MKIDIKKTFVEPIKNKKIKVPNVKNIMLLKQAETYESYLELGEEQESDLSKNTIKFIVPAILGIACAGTSLFEYVKTLRVNDKYFDDAELMINEAAADNELNKGE